MPKIKGLTTILTVLLCLLASSTVSYGESAASPAITAQERAVLLARTNHLHEVTPTLYRSEQLDQDDTALLQALNIRTIINLRYFNRDDDHRHFGHTDIRIINIPLLTWDIEAEEMAQVLYTIEQSEKYGNVLVHCYHGEDRTGLTIGLYRIFYQNWSAADAEAEMRRYGYNRIWRNIPRFYKPKKLAAVRRALEALRRSGDSSVAHTASTTSGEGESVR